MNHASPSSEPVGLTLQGSYRITRKIGEGGMGTVYEAFHVRLTKKRFAIKFLHPAVVAMPEVYARFRREAEITTELGHPNIVNVLDFNQTEQGQPYIVMEFLEGENLGARVLRAGRLSIPEVIQVLGEAASALQAAHDKGIVHRDMKPENIFLAGPLDGPFTTKILDFGISKILHSKSVITRDQAVFGTPYYMSPEQAEGIVSDIDARTDIFAMGSICYQILTGQLPFDAPTLPGVIYQVCHREPRPVSELVEEIPDDIDLVLSRALAKNKDHRYQRIEDFAVDLATTAVKQQICYGQPQPISTHIAGIPTGVEGVLSRALAKNKDHRYQRIEDFAADLAASIAGARPADSSQPGIDSRRIARPQGASTAVGDGAKDGSGSMTTLSSAAGETALASPIPYRSRHRRIIFSAAFASLALLVGGGLVVMLKPTDRDRGPRDARELAGPKSSSAASTTPASTTPASTTPASTTPASTTPASTTPASTTPASTTPASTTPASTTPASTTPASTAPAAAKPATIPKTTPLNPEPAAAESASTVRIKLEVTPRDARVRLDGKDARDNPLVLPADNKQHRLSLEARNHEPTETIFVADKSQTIRLVLIRKTGANLARPEPEPAARPRAKKKIKRFRFDDL